MKRIHNLIICFVTFYVTFTTAIVNEITIDVNTTATNQTVSDGPTTSSDGLIGTYIFF